MPESATLISTIGLHVLGVRVVGDTQINRDAPSVRRILYGVIQQVDEHLDETLLIADHQREGLQETSSSPYGVSCPRVV